MSVIKRRTVYVEIDPDGAMRFAEWATVDTPLGMMVEPFMMNQRNPEDFQNDWDPTDEINRVDEIAVIDSDKLPFMLSNDDTITLFGGNQTPRVGR